ncbi:MAG: hypothetical protein ACE5KG_00225 [Nitrososphaerales archaeon]
MLRDSKRRGLGHLSALGIPVPLAGHRCLGSNKKRKKNIGYLIILVILIISFSTAFLLYEPEPPKDVQSTLVFEAKKVQVEMRVIRDAEQEDPNAIDPAFILKPRLLVNGTLVETFTLEPVMVGSKIQSMVGFTSNPYPPSWILFQESSGSQPVRIVGNSDYQIQVCTKDTAERCSPFPASVQPYFAEKDGELIHYTVFNITVGELIFYEYLPRPPPGGVVVIP